MSMPTMKWKQNLLTEFGKTAQVEVDEAVEVVAAAGVMKNVIVGQRDGSRRPDNRCQSTMSRMLMTNWQKAMWTILTTYLLR
jgi:hypothetical protein